MKKGLIKIYNLINYILAGSLILSYLSTYISPEYLPFLQFFGLIYPYLLFLNIFFLVLGIIKKQIISLLLFLTIAIGINHLSNFIAYKNKSTDKTSGIVKVLSYNVRLFNIYDWIKDKKTASKIIDIIRQENADIICLQEFYSNSKKYNYKDSIIKIQKANYNVISYQKEGKSSGNAIFSKYPIINEGIINVGTSNHKCIFADIVIKKDTLRVYSIHLASVHLDKADYETIDEKVSEKKIIGTVSIISKMKNAYKIRAHEVNIIHPHIEHSPYKTIICGDFNDVPTSYTYQKLKTGYKDAFKESGIGTASTYINNLLFFRIDYILHSPEMESYDFKCIKEEYSDHYPISCKISLDNL